MGGLSHSRRSDRLGLPGAGGSWTVGGERKDKRAIVQADGDACGCACALVVFRLLGMPQRVSQAEIAQLGGGTPFSVNTLSYVMNSLWTKLGRSGTWLGLALDEPEGKKYRDVITMLTQVGPWIAHLRERGTALGHFVVVAQFVGRRLEILDPASPGTRYTMTITSFIKVWSYEAVFLEPI